MPDRYPSFETLGREQVEGRDYMIQAANEGSAVLVMAPHGGGIEPGTTELARAVAGEQWGFYSFMGLKPARNFEELHITSARFDEPLALRMAAASLYTVTLHGCRELDGVVFLGGLDMELRELIREHLSAAGFPVSHNPAYPGTGPANICNRNSRGRGVQIEVSLGLRRAMFPAFPRRNLKSARFAMFTRAVRSAIAEKAGTTGH